MTSWIPIRTSLRRCRQAPPIPASSKAEEPVPTRTRSISSLVTALAIASILTPAAVIVGQEEAAATPQLCPPTFDWCIGDGDPGPDPDPGSGGGPVEEPRGCGE